MDKSHLKEAADSAAKLAMESVELQEHDPQTSVTKAIHALVKLTAVVTQLLDEPSIDVDLKAKKK